MWYVYIVECSDKTLYTGITTDIENRIKHHNTSNLGAKYTRGKRPVKLVYSSKMKDKASASKEEYRIKRLSRKEKMEMVTSYMHLF